MIKGNENKAENEKQITKIRKHRHKYTKYKMCVTIMIVRCNKQHLSNMFSPLHETVKQHCACVEKSVDY